VTLELAACKVCHRIQSFLTATFFLLNAAFHFPFCIPVETVKKLHHNLPGGRRAARPRPDRTQWSGRPAVSVIDGADRRMLARTRIYAGSRGSADRVAAKSTLRGADKSSVWRGASCPWNSSTVPSQDARRRTNELAVTPLPFGPAQRNRPVLLCREHAFYPFRAAIIRKFQK
jgi:hypothetical protein